MVAGRRDSALALAEYPNPRVRRVGVRRQHFGDRDFRSIVDDDQLEIAERILQDAGHGLLQQLGPVAYHDAHREKWERQIRAHNRQGRGLYLTPISPLWRYVEV